MNLLHRVFQWLWYGYSPLRYLFWLPAQLFLFLSARRRRAYIRGDSPVYHAPVPVIVVGNINVGGTGKTPLTLWLLDALQQRGFTPGVVSRGYGSSVNHYPHLVNEADTAALVGDEPLMIHLRSGVPVMIDPDRSRAVKALLRENPVNVIISDDGLQHYRLARTVEVVVVDGARGFGNGSVLPMGPLREPVERVREADILVVNGKSEHPSFVQLDDKPDAVARCEMQLRPGELVPLNPESELQLSRSGLDKVVAVAGIGHPQRFFGTLSSMGLDYVATSFPDHYQYKEQDIAALTAHSDRSFIVTTEKDAVKMRQFPAIRGAYLPVDAELQDGLIDVIIGKLEDFNSHHRHRY